MDREYFKQLQKDASDNMYPGDSTKLRQAHADYARGLIARVRDAGADIIAANKAEGQYEKMSEAASKTTISQCISGIDEVERYMDQQQVKASAGQTVGLLDGNGRHLLSSALVGLYFEMKDFYAAVGRGLITETGEVVLMKDFYAAVGRALVTETGEVVLPENGEVTGVADKGTAVVESFLNKMLQPA